MQAGAQSDSSKPTTQAMFDKSRREKDNQVHGGTGQSVMDKVKNAVGLGGEDKQVWKVSRTLVLGCIFGEKPCFIFSNHRSYF